MQSRLCLLGLSGFYVFLAKSFFDPPPTIENYKMSMDDARNEKESGKNNIHKEINGAPFLNINSHGWNERRKYHCVAITAGHHQMRKDRHSVRKSGDAVIHRIIVTRRANQKWRE